MEKNRVTDASALYGIQKLEKPNPAFTGKADSQLRPAGIVGVGRAGGHSYTLKGVLVKIQDRKWEYFREHRDTVWAGQPMESQAP